MELTIMTPLDINLCDEELTVELPDGFATVYVAIEPTSLESHDLTVAAEVWRDGMDDDGDGEPVTTVEGLASLLRCDPTERAIARCLDRALSDITLSRWKAR
jgi:hypothetical protein